MADVITRLKIESGEYDSKIKRAVSGLQQMEQECRRVNGTLATLEKDQKQYVQSLGQMETVSRTVRGKIGELSNAFVELRAQYNRLTEDEKKGDYGKALSSSLEQLKTRIKDAKTELNGIQGELNGSKFGQFGGVIDTIGHKLGLTANATELLTSKTALMYAGIGAGIAIVTKATEAWVGYNNELAKQDQITTVTTGLKGEDADRMTDKMRALSDTYKVDFREAVNAANTLMTQFGKTGDEATQLIKDGMQGMIQGDGPKLLQMIQQYAPAFRDAGVSASQLVAVIQNSEGGIFTDQNMNAIVMGIKNIRLMTKQTSEALQKLGIDGQEMTRKLNDGSLTIFDALKQVASQLKNVDSNSQAAGEVMQAVFGRQGVTAGTNVAKAIETLNTNLEETKKQTGEVGDAFAELQTANEKLNAAIREAFSYDGWEQMAAGIKADLITALADVIEYLGKIKNFWAGNQPKGTPVLPDWSENSLEYVKGGGTKEEREKRYNFELKRLQKSYADAGKPYSYIDKNGGLTEVLRDPREQNEVRIGAIRAIRTLQANKDYLITGEKPKTDNVKTNTGGGSTTPKTKAGNTTDDVVAKAEKAYAETMNMAQRDLMEGVITSQKYDETIYNGQKKLAEAYNKAYEETGNEKYLKAYQETAEHVTEMQGVVDANITAQKAAEQSARELEQAQKKVADAMEKSATAYQTNDLKGYIAAQKSVGGDATVGFNADTFGATESNIQAFLGHLKEQISQADLGSELYNNLTAQIADANMLGNLMQVAVQNGIDIAQFMPEELWRKIFGENPGDYIEDSTWQELTDIINEQLASLKINPIKININTGDVKQLGKDANVSAKEFQNAASAVGQLGAAMKQIEDPTAKVVGMVAQSIAAVAQGFATATSKEAGKGVWGWIAAIAAGTAAMVNTIATIHSATGYANGGIIQGNSYSGDNMMAAGPDGNLIGLNAGELILNKAQQNNLANALENEGGGSMGAQPYLDGELIYLGLQAYGRRTGMGELVFSNN